MSAVPPAIRLRQAHPADWPAVESLLGANRLPLDGAREHLATFVLAQSGLEGGVGCAGVEPRGEVALLLSVAVGPGLQRQGIGLQMVSLLLDEARRRNFKTVALLTTTARRWFQSLGFRTADRATASAALKASAEFQGACAASADYMVLSLQSERPSGLEGLPVAVLGAGPVGLAAAAQLIDRGIPFFILEAAPAVGANLREYGHVRLFSPWRYDIDATMARLLAPTGWQAPEADALPLAAEVVTRVLEPFARLPQVASALHLSTQVVAVTREGFDKVKSAGRDRAPFVIRALQGGQTREFQARAVIDATGTWRTPNPVGASGLPAIGEAEAGDRIFYGVPDVLGLHRSRYAGRRTLVVGAGHSAANVLLALAELAGQAPGTQMAWSVRSPVLTRVFGGGDADALPARGALGSALRALRDAGGMAFHAGLRITRIDGQGGALRVIGVDADGREQQIDGVDQIVCATGQRPDLSLTSELRVKLDPWLDCNEALGPLIDPNLHSCGTVRPHGHRELGHPEPGLYTVGVKSYGRAPTFLMATGFEQVRSVVAALAGDTEAADRVEFDLPQTGVCSIGDGHAERAAESGCCGADATVPTVGEEPASAAAVLAPATSCGTASCGAGAREMQPVAPTTAGYCGGEPKVDASACCALDEQKNAKGAAGCGCPPGVPSAPEKARATAGCC